MSFKKTILPEEIGFLAKQGLRSTQQCSAFLRNIKCEAQRRQLTPQEKQLKRLAYKAVSNPENRRALNGIGDVAAHAKGTRQ